MSQSYGTPRLPVGAWPFAPLPRAAQSRNVGGGRYLLWAQLPSAPEVQLRHMMTADSSTLATHLFGPLPASLPTFSTPAVIGAMLDSGSGISDLIFSPGRPPQVEKHGELSRVDIKELPLLHAPDTARLARDIIGDNPTALRALHEQGASDLSYSLPERARFRVNIFRQRGSFAIVMRVIAPRIPTLAELELPKALADIAPLKNGIVLVTGPTGSGQVDDARGDHRSDQRDPGRSHPDHRGSDRVPAQSQEVDRSISASCTATRRPSPWPCGPRCVRRRR